MPDESNPPQQTRSDRKRPRPEAEDRAARLAAALRKNLVRRKAQARARAGETRDGEN